MYSTELEDGALRLLTGRANRAFVTALNRREVSAMNAESNQSISHDQQFSFFSYDYSLASSSLDS